MRSEYKLSCVFLLTLVRDWCARTKTSRISQGQPSTILFWGRKKKSQPRGKEDIWRNEIQSKAQAYIPVGSAPFQSLRITGQGYEQWPLELGSQEELFKRGEKNECIKHTPFAWKTGYVSGRKFGGCILLTCDCPAASARGGRGEWGWPDGLGLDKNLTSGKWEFCNSVRD